LEMDTLAKDALPNETNSTINTSVINENVSDWANQYLKSGSSFAVSIYMVFTIQFLLSIVLSARAMSISLFRRFNDRPSILLAYRR